MLHREIITLPFKKAARDALGHGMKPYYGVKITSAGVFGIDSPALHCF